jgi:hypothetical protein
MNFYSSQVINLYRFDLLQASALRASLASAEASHAQAAAQLRAKDDVLAAARGAAREAAGRAASLAAQLQSAMGTLFATCQCRPCKPELNSLVHRLQRRRRSSGSGLLSWRHRRRGCPRCSKRRRRRLHIALAWPRLRCVGSLRFKFH